MTAIQTLPAVADNRRQTPTVPNRAVSILLLAVVLMSGARELAGLWQQAADHLARASADRAVRCVAHGFELAAEAGLATPPLPELAALDLARTTVEGVLSCVLVLVGVCYACGLVVAAGSVTWVRSACSGTRLPAAL